MKMDSIAVRMFFWLALISLIVFVMIQAKQVLIPILIAMILAYGSISFSKSLKSVRIAKISLPPIFYLILSFAIVLLLGWFFISILAKSSDSLLQALPGYERGLINFLSGFLQSLGLDPSVVNNMFTNQNISGVFSDIISSVAGIGSSMALILIYTIFMLAEYEVFMKKLHKFTLNSSQKMKIRALTDRIISSTNTYIRIKTLASIGTALLSYIVLISFGIELAAVWALLVFVLNYIPTVGSIVAIIFPTIMGFIQYGLSFKALFLLLLLVFVQLLVGNYLEPLFAGKKLDLSPLIIILALLVFGQIWGIVGMILSVPILIILRIVLAEIPSMRGVAVMISGTGEL